jgi:hypothetical protein
MAKFNYKASQATALRLINQFGETLPLIRFVKEFNPITGNDLITSITFVNSICVNLPATNGTIQAFDNKTVEELKKGKNRFFYMVAKGLEIEPDSDDYLIYEGKFWRIAGTTPLNPAGTPILYNVGCMDGGITFDYITSNTELAEIYLFGLYLLKEGFEDDFIALETDLFESLNHYAS